jgi:glycosyltransferase involved in cell wall biosynthesis
LKELAARGHFIHLACLIEANESSDAKELAKTFSIHPVISSRKPTIGGALTSLIHRTPYQITRFHNHELLQHCRQLLRSSPFDILQVEGIQAAYYALTLGAEFDIPTVLRVHDVLSLNMARLIGHAHNPLMKLWLAIDMRRVRSYEQKVYPCAGTNLTVSDIERDMLLQMSPTARCEVVPLGVDLATFAPSDIIGDPHTVLWLGAMNYTPNRDSFWWFYNEIVPRVLIEYPHASIRVAGTGMPDEILALRHPNVDILGFISDIRQAITRAQVCVVPLRIGSGVRIKLLEMFAMGRAVVSTSIGAEGLGVSHDKHLLIADTPEQFAHSVVGLLLDSTWRSRLGAEARAYVTQQFSLDSVVGRFEAIYRSLLRDPDNTAGNVSKRA